MGEKNLTFIGHLTELRNRLIVMVIAIIIGTVASYAFVVRLTELALVPAQGLKFIYITPPELFLAYIRISLLAGITLTSPITLMQVWLFLKPGFTKGERRSISVSLFAGIIFFLLGVLFAYSVILPLTLHFFVKISFPDIEPMFSVGSYIGFVSSLLLSFGLVFEMPIVVVLLAKFNLISVSTLRRYRKMVILGIVILAAVLTPPDIVSQILLAGPMIFLFEISVLFANLVTRKKHDGR